MTPTAIGVALAIFFPLAGLTLAIYRYLIGTLDRSLKDLTDRVLVQNGRLNRLEAWREVHEGWSIRESTRLQDEIGNIEREGK